MCEVGERLGDGILAAAFVDMAVGVNRLDGDLGFGVLRHVVVEVVHDEITILLAHETEGNRLAVLVVVTCGEGILTLAAETVHQVLLAIFYRIHLPSAVGIENIRHKHVLAFLQCPILGIVLAVEVGFGTEESHLLGTIPEGALVVAIG